MIRRFIDFGNRYVVGKMEDPNSMLYKLVQTSRDEEEGTKKIKKAYLVLLLVLLLGFLNQILSLWHLKASYLPASPVIFLIGTMVSLLTFVFATNYEYFNFWNRKKWCIYVIIGFMVMTTMSVMAMVFCEIFLPIIFKIPISPDITVGMVVGLARFLYVMVVTIPSVYICYQMLLAVNQPENQADINTFKIRKYVDFRKDKEFLYDLRIIKRMEDGSSYVIKEKDRQLHIILNGVTGVGKTSAAFVPAITSDLDQKAYNEDYTKKELVQRILTFDDIHPDKEMTDENFSLEYFWPKTEEAKVFLERLKKKAPSAGITVIAPNADLADAVYELATIRGFKNINRVDPIPQDRRTGQMKPGFIGFNPLYISDTLSPYQRKLEIFKKSRMFSDVLQALYEQSGKTDQYFTSLNRNLTTMISILVMVAYPYLHNGKQPDMTAVQAVINDFSEVRKYLFALGKMEGVAKDIAYPVDVSYEWLRGKKFGEYQFIVSQISYDLLGPGRVKMEDQARGLRTIINEFLTDPLVRNLVCAKETVDIDRCLEYGEITVVNFGLELGMSIATGLGQFFTLSFNQAVLRRPGTEDTRLLHLFYCDELPVLLHKDMESMYSLWRQFKACSFAAFQTTAQFEKNETTRYLKDVVISNVGHHIVYGRLSSDDMKLYEELAGQKMDFVEQKTISETALSSSDPHMSFSTRIVPQLGNVMDGYRIRNKDFQEVTIFGVNNGDYVEPFEGKLSFLTKEQKEGRGRCSIDWEQFKYQEDYEELTFKETMAYSRFEDFLDLDEVLEASDLSYLKAGSIDKDILGNDKPPKTEEDEPQIEEDWS